jgi:hypothetical protein
MRLSLTPLRLSLKPSLGLVCFFNKTLSKACGPAGGVVRLRLLVVVVRISRSASVKIVVLTLHFLQAVNIVFVLSVLLVVVVSWSLSMRIF